MPGVLGLVKPKSVPIFGTCSYSLVDASLPHVCNVTVVKQPAQAVPSPKPSRVLSVCSRSKWSWGHTFTPKHLPVSPLITPRSSHKESNEITFTFVFLSFFFVFLFYFILVSERKGENERGDKEKRNIHVVPLIYTFTG